jgi:hypothetical protein
MRTGAFTTTSLAKGAERLPDPLPPTPKRHLCECNYHLGRHGLIGAWVEALRCLTAFRGRGWRQLLRLEEQMHLVRPASQVREPI